MDLKTEDIDSAITKVVLTGRLDIAGASAIDMKMSVIAGSGKSLLIDLKGVTFLASLGIRCLVMTAKTVHGRGGKVLFLDPDPSVEKVLDMAGILDMIPVSHDMAEALVALRG